jgi:HK97 family phage major capsid protein
MPYNSIISRTDATSLIPPDRSLEIFKDVATLNPVLQMAKRLPNLATHQRTIPVLNQLALAYFVSGDTGLKETTETAWTGVNLTVEELAVIVPISQAVLDDSDYDIWGETRPQLVEAFSIAISGALFYGTNIPASWTVALGAAGLFAGATAAGHVVSRANYADLYEAIMGQTNAGVQGLLMTLEADGFVANGHIASPLMRGRLRNARDINGNPLFQRSMQDKTRFELDGEPIYFPTDNTITDATSWMFSGDWTKLVYAMRQDITYKMLDQAVIQDAGGNIVYNLAQQDMVALRAVMRLGFALPNPINRMQPVAASRFPFAVLTA